MIETIILNVRHKQQKVLEADIHVHEIKPDFLDKKKRDSDLQFNDINLLHNWI